MELLTADLRHQLSANWIDGQENAAIGQAELDYAPVLKLFTPWAQATWLLTELNQDTGILFGLCDLGLGCAELGYVSLQELEQVRGPVGLTIERDLHWKPKATLSVYAEAARRPGRIVTNIEALAAAQQYLAGEARKSGKACMSRLLGED